MSPTQCCSTAALRGDMGYFEHVEVGVLFTSTSESHADIKASSPPAVCSCGAIQCGQAAACINGPRRGVKPLLAPVAHICKTTTLMNCSFLLLSLFWPRSMKLGIVHLVCTWKWIQSIWALFATYLADVESKEPECRSSETHLCCKPVCFSNGDSRLCRSVGNLHFFSAILRKRALPHLMLQPTSGGPQRPGHFPPSCYLNGY